LNVPNRALHHVRNIDAIEAGGNRKRGAAHGSIVGLRLNFDGREVQPDGLSLGVNQAEHLSVRS
jgi:hypothetical protein